MLTSRVHCRCYSAWSICGVRLSIRATGPSRLNALAALLPENREPISASQADCSFGVEPVLENGIRRYRVLENSEPVGLFPSFASAGDCLRSRVELFMAENSTRYVFVHAGVVGIDGAAVLIPGDSCSGKTSLVARLVEAGAEYFSDEYALLDAEGRVHAYPRSLGVRGAAAKQYIDPRSLGSVTQMPLRAGLVLLTSYRADGRWRPQRVSAARATLGLLANTLPARRRPAWALHAIRSAVEGSTCLAGARGDAEQIVSQLLPERRHTSQ